MKKVIAEIRAVALQISGDEFNRLWLEETMLNTLIRSNKHNLDVKKLAFQRIDEINQRQREITGNLMAQVK